jgi:hypothetical protein
MTSRLRTVENIALCGIVSFFAGGILVAGQQPPDAAGLRQHPPTDLVLPAAVLAHQGAFRHHSGIDPATPGAATDSRSARGGERYDGDTCANPIVIPSLPFSDSRNTCVYTNDYDEVCPYAGSTAPDVVYAYTPADDEGIAVVLCDGATVYDTKVYVYEDICPDSGNPIACNDDACETVAFPWDYVSQLGGVPLTAGHTYYIVVDGFSHECGDYYLDVFTVPSSQCPSEIMYGQDAHPPWPEWEAATSASAYTVYDDFAGADRAISGLSWWGLSLVCCWTECDPTGMTFEITYYEDALGQAGREMCTYVVQPEITRTYSVYSGMELYHFSVPALDPVCYLGAGWVSVRSQPRPDDCLFLWMSSPDGNGNSWQMVNGLEPLLFDRAFCLIGDGEPVYGACCDEVSATCTDNVALNDCGLPGRFLPNGTCAELSPSCGEATGACCLPDGTCAITTAGACDGSWLGADSTCDLCPCVIPCAPDEGEPTCHDGYVDAYNGGCNSDPAVFQPITCGQTICGESGTYLSDGSPARDTDWFELVTTEGGAYQFDVEAEFPVGIYAIDGSLGCGDYDVLVGAEAGACYTASVTTPCLPPGRYWFWVGPVNFNADVPCGARYTATLTCVGSAPDFEITGPGTWSGNTCDAGNNSTLRPSPDHSYRVTLPASGEWVFDVSDASWDTVLYLGTGCSQGNIAMDDNGCDSQTRLDLYLDAGEYWLTLEGDSSNGCGEYTLNVTYIEPCIVECAPGSDSEGEPRCSDGYADTYNGGCDSATPMFQPVTCGQTVCGESGVFLSGTTVTDRVYMHVYCSGDLTVFDTSTSVETTVGDTGINGFFGMAAAPVPVPKAGGGYWPAGTLFGLERNDGKLYVVDENDGSLTFIGSDPDNLDGSQGLAFNGAGELFAMRDGDNDGEFYQVSTETGMGTYLGFCDEYDLDGLTVFPFDMNIADFGTAHTGDFLACNGEELYHIDPDTFTPTYIGDAPAHQTLDFSPSGTLYGQDWNGGLYTITLDPLGETRIGTVSENVDGMAVLEVTGLPTRDEDWYELITSEEGVYTWTVEAEFDVDVSIIDAQSGDCADYAVITSGSAGECVTEYLTTDCLPGGQYWLRVRPTGLVGVPCGAKYNATLTCASCFVLGDLDGDRDVDVDDFVLFAGCMDGPAAATPPPTCDPAVFIKADLEEDGDVDLQDLAVFQQVFNGGG